MSIAESAYKQTSMIKRYIGLDGYGKAQYQPAVEIKCKIKSCHKVIKTAEGKEIVCQSSICTPVFIGDLDAFVIAGKTVPVGQVDEKVGLDGAVDHYEVLL